MKNNSIKENPIILMFFNFSYVKYHYIINPNCGQAFKFANVGQHHSLKKIFLGISKNSFHKFQ